MLGKEHSEMDGAVREMNARELIEQSNLKNKEVILKRLQMEREWMEDRIKRTEETVIEQAELIKGYRAVLKDLYKTN
jgi:RNA polymerase-interacting CarD/CdnL/TRCF family regulator